MGFRVAICDNGCGDEKADTYNAGIIVKALNRSFEPLSHYHISIVTHALSKEDKITKSLMEIIDLLESQGGPLNCFKGNAYDAAELLSKNKKVESVIVTHISETSCGVWRNGVKS